MSIVFLDVGYDVAAVVVVKLFVCLLLRGILVVVDCSFDVLPLLFLG